MTPKPRKLAKARKPHGRFWCGVILLPEDLLKRYGRRNLRGLRDWLTKVIDWAEQGGGK